MWVVFIEGDAVMKLGTVGIVTPMYIKRMQSLYRTDKAIGDILGVTRQAVYRVRKELGIIPLANNKKQRNKKIIELNKQGLTGFEIARRLKISVTTVRRITQKFRGKK